MSHYVLAQCNIARLAAPLESPQLQPFVSQLPTINALAERSPGFVWRLQTPAGDATAIQIFEDPAIILNMSVWESIDALFEFTYQTSHAAVMRNRGDWFERHTDLYMALWWVPTDQMPVEQDARIRVEYLRANGPTPFAFTFRQRFPAPTE